MWKIGNITIKNKIVLAPMAGISNPAYMKICEEMGVGYAITELISSEAIIRNNKKTLDMLKGIDNLNIPVAVQIFGRDKDTMASAAKIITSIYKNVFIDINMGCPVPKVAVRAKAGSALLKEPDKVYEIVKSVVDVVDVPVTVKIRSGWDANSINAVEIAKIIEKAGAQAITVHARTRAQGYSGKADWNIIKEVKQNVSIPVIGNGDVKTCYDAKNMQKLQMIKKHATYLFNNKPAKVALLEMRTNAAYYLKGIPGSAKIKNQIFKTNTKEELLNLLEQCINKS